MSQLWRNCALSCLFLFLALIALPAHAANITLQGVFDIDDTVQLFDIVLNTTGNVDFRTYGYAGGTSSTGQSIPRGGFDPILTLFNSSGVFIVENDDGLGVATDPATQQALDARITRSLSAGQYILALTQYDNFVTGATLNDGFDEAGRGNFTAEPGFTSGGPCPSGQFRDISGTAGQCRNGNWTVDFLNVAQVTARPVAAIPEPSAALLFIVGLVALGAASWRSYYFSHSRN